MANAEKTAAVEELTGKFRESSGAVLTEYRGLTVAQLKALRGSLAGNATFSVVKNTLTKLAATEAGVGDELTPLLSGPRSRSSAGTWRRPPRACSTSPRRTRCS